jgi:hypothetical protein
MLRTDGNFLGAGAGIVPGSRSGKYGVNLPDVLDSIYAGYTKTAAIALPEKSLRGRIWIDDQPYVWAPDCTVNDTSNLLALRPTIIASASDPGRFVAELPEHVLGLDFTHATADAAALFTVPTGCKLHLLAPWWDITTSMSGGSSSAIGVSSGKTGFTAKGCLLGGSAGDVAATLTAAASPALGTRGLLAAPAGSRIVQETVAVASASATPRFAVQRLLHARTIGTGAAGQKTALPNGGTPSAGEAAPAANGSTIAFNAETTGTGTVEIAYLTTVGATIENTLWVGGDTIRFDRIVDVFTAGAGKVRVAVRVVRLPRS